MEHFINALKMNFIIIIYIFIFLFSIFQVKKKYI